jgi:hypothetical protein
MVVFDAAGNWYDGLANAMATRYSSPRAEPLARQLAAVWATSE